MTQPTQTRARAIEESEDFPLEKFYRPSEGLTTRICDRIDSLEAEAISGIDVRERSDLEEANSPPADDADLSSPSSSEMIIQQRLIAEELDGCIVDAAESEAGRNGERISIQRVVTEGMSDAFGLESNDPLLSELAVEFQGWLVDAGCYTAGWGNIISAQPGYMYLEAFPIAEEEEAEPDFTFTRSHQPGEAKNSSGLIGRIVAAVAAKLEV
jgi:hypothetical protein